MKKLSAFILFLCLILSGCSTDIIPKIDNVDDFLTESQSIENLSYVENNFVDINDNFFDNIDDVEFQNNYDENSDIVKEEITDITENGIQESKIPEIQNVINDEIVISNKDVTPTESGVATENSYVTGTINDMSYNEATNDNETRIINPDENVWIPSSGSKYHSYSSCSNMKNPTQVTKSYAISMGYTACKRCY